MNHLTKIKIIKQLSERELENHTSNSASWHMKYKNSSYIHISGLNYEMNEGDIVTVFSQYGEIIDCRLLRDKITGKSQGTAFLCYEDQQSTILAVDNFNGTEICGRTIKVDHVDNYKPNLNIKSADIESMDIDDLIYKPTGPDGLGWGKYRVNKK